MHHLVSFEPISSNVFISKKIVRLATTHSCSAVKRHRQPSLQVHPWSSHWTYQTPYCWHPLARPCLKWWKRISIVRWLNSNAGACVTISLFWSIRVNVNQSLLGTQAVELWSSIILYIFLHYMMKNNGHNKKLMNYFTMTLMSMHTYETFIPFFCRSFAFASTSLAFLLLPSQCWDKKLATVSHLQ